jgi:NADH-quinone oxidoreductase subunit A
VPGDYAFNYTAVVVAAIFGFAGVGSFFILSWLLAPRRASPLTSIAYECGIVPVGEGNTRYNVRYYLFALFFLIFAVEAAFIAPWIFVYLDLPVYVFFEMIVFLAILFFGIVYAWRKGVLQWR